MSTYARKVGRLAVVGNRTDGMLILNGMYSRLLTAMNSYELTGGVCTLYIHWEAMRSQT